MSLSFHPKLLSADAIGAFGKQADACARMGSNFTASICSMIAEHGLPVGKISERISSWVGIQHHGGDAVPLRLTGALHRLVLDGVDSGLAAVYPPNPHNEDTLYEAVGAAILRHADYIDDYLNLPPQTNEVGRSAIFLPALLHLSKRHRLPFNIFELGASAGLNQGLAHFFYDYGDWCWGNKSSPVQLACEWQGAPTLVTDQEIMIVRAQGCDIAPLPIQTDPQRQRLRSYVWPDQPERLMRLDGALSIAEMHTPHVEQVSAADWLSRVLVTPERQHHSLIMHSIMWQYMSLEEQENCESVIGNFGAKATNDAPVSWLRFEADGQSPGALLSLTQWCGDANDGTTIALARADYHGKWIAWSDPQ